jgi:hypothetical protein
MFRGAARANLALSWLPERLVEQNWNLEEPPTKAGRWVATVLHTAKQLRYKLDTAEGLSTADKDLVDKPSLSCPMPPLHTTVGYNLKCTISMR